MEKTYMIKYNWKHVEGHIATSHWKGSVCAIDEDEAIIKYKKLNPRVGIYIKKDEENSYWYYGSKNIYTLKEDNIVYAVEIN